MSKYKQTTIPETTIIWENIETTNELRETVFEYYRNNIMGKSIVNIDKGYKIQFTNKPGGRKIAFGGSMYREKAEAVKMIMDLIRVAQYNNWGHPKTTDKEYVIGYLNFKAKGKINGKMYNFRIAIQLRTDGNLYYNHEINIIKNKKT